MKPKKIQKQAQKDKTWQDKIEKRVEAEKIKVDHPKGKERFEQVIRRIRNKKP